MTFSRVLQGECEDRNNSIIIINSWFELNEMCNLISLYKRGTQPHQVQRSLTGGGEGWDAKKKLKVGICFGVGKGAATPSIREKELHCTCRPAIKLNTQRNATGKRRFYRRQMNIFERIYHHHHRHSFPSSIYNHQAQWAIQGTNRTGRCSTLPLFLGSLASLTKGLSFWQGAHVVEVNLPLYKIVCGPNWYKY